jgi:hypothetical protein
MKLFSSKSGGNYEMPLNYVAATLVITRIFGW